MKSIFYTYFACILSAQCLGQINIAGHVTAEGLPLEFANVVIDNAILSTITDSSGAYYIENIPRNAQEISFSFIGYKRLGMPIKNNGKRSMVINAELEIIPGVLDEVVVTGTMREVIRSNSPVPVEVYQPIFFKRNPTPNVYEALQNVNGVRPQLNCNVCNTGDIHINGLEGPYTMVLIDGMPIVSSLASVYGLSGIPNSLIQRMEIIKGPASSLYGSEAIGGLINIITKNPDNAPLLEIEMHSTSWLEHNVDVGFTIPISNKISVLTGINYYNYQNPLDNNRDNFTDIALQNRISIFQKWSFARKDQKLFSLAGRYYNEDRWGGEMQWTNEYRGGSEIYGESVYTKRGELIAQYELPYFNNTLFSASLNFHDQNSAYGNTLFLARQNIAFAQLTWREEFSNHSLLLGSSFRYTYYDDNTPATGGDKLNPRNEPDKQSIPGIFIQDEISLNGNHDLLLGLRNDFHKDHGMIVTPRLAYKWKINDTNTLRFNAGTGFRVVNIFTEDHAALTGAREVIINEELKPEKSINFNLNYVKKFYFNNGGAISMDVSGWYTHFYNLILPDYDTHPNQIIYSNADDYALSRGISINADVNLSNGLALRTGITLMDVNSFSNGDKSRPYLTEKFSSIWGFSYNWGNHKYRIDYTGNVYGPMRLPLAGYLDPRKSESPYWSIQNIQFTQKFGVAVEVFGGFKNILNWTPNKGNPFIIARAEDPFDNDVVFDAHNNVLPSEDNPYGLTFDPSYVFGPNQGRRFFIGMRYAVQK
jgi:outer membrane receptor for ferrienterochelin and colicins